MASRSMESLLTHDALGYLYSGLVMPTLVKGVNSNIAASCFIVDLINTVLSFVTDGETSTGDFRDSKASRKFDRNGIFDFT